MLTSTETSDPEDTDPVIERLKCFTLEMVLLLFYTLTGKESSMVTFFMPEVIIQMGNRFFAIF